MINEYKYALLRGFIYERKIVGNTKRELACMYCAQLV